MAGDREQDEAEDAVEPEFRDDAGSGDVGPEETGPEGLGPGSGTGSAHDYPGRAPADEDEAERQHEAGDAAEEPDHRRSGRD